MYLSLDQSRSVNAYFTVFSESIVVRDDAGPSTLAVRWWVKVAGKYRSTLKSAFHAIDRNAALSELGLSPELSASLQLDFEGQFVKLQTKMHGQRSELVARCAHNFEQFVLTFQKLLLPSK